MNLLKYQLFVIRRCLCFNQKQHFGWLRGTGTKSQSIQHASQQIAKPQYYQPNPNKINNLEITDLINKIRQKNQSEEITLNKLKKIFYKIVQSKHQLQQPLILLEFFKQIHEIKTNSKMQLLVKVIEFMVRQQLYQQVPCLSSEFLKIYINSLLLLLQNLNQKVKISYFKNYTYKVIITNFQNLHYNDYFEIVKLYRVCEQKLVNQKYRLSSVIYKLQKSLNSIFEEIINNKQSLKKYQKLFKASKIYDLLEIYSFYGFQNQQYQHTFAKFLQKFIMSKTISVNLFSTFSLLQSDLLTKQGLNLKDLNLFLISKNYTFYKRTASESLMYSILRHEISKSYQKLSFKQEGAINYLMPSEVVRPILPKIFWEIYRKDLNYTLQHIRLKILVEKLYPQQIKTKEEVQYSDKILTPSKLFQNQISMKVQMCLNELNIKYTNQAEIIGRFPDILVQDDIIIQVDGVIHFHPRKLEQTQSTKIRNMCFLLCNYRLILINIYQYAQYRTKDQLKQLILAKLDCLKRNKAVMII